MDTMAHSRVKDFEQRLLEHLEEVLIERGETPRRQRLELEIKQGLDRLALYELHRERDVARYIEIVVVHMDGFLKGPLPKEATDILCDHRVGPEEKVDRLEKWTRAHGQSAPPTQGQPWEDFS